MTRRALALALLLVGSSIATPRSAPVISPAGTSADAAATPTGLSRERITAPSGAVASSLPQAAPAVPEPIGSVAASPQLRTTAKPSTAQVSQLANISTALIGGYATWYDACARCAAAGPALRSMLGSGWRGTVVTVEGPAGATVSVVLSDWCACAERHGKPTLLDLSREAFSELVHPSAGIVAVSIELPAQLPSTDTEEPR